MLTAPKREFQVYPDLSGNYRFRVVDTQNGQTVLSSEAYDTRYNAQRAANREASLQLDGGRVIDLDESVKPTKRRSFLARLFGG